MRKNSKNNITAESLPTLAEQAVANARARRAQVLEDLELEQAVGGVAIDRGLAQTGVRVGGVKGGQTMGLWDPPPDHAIPMQKE